MSENEQQSATEVLDLSGLGSFDFTPAWAKGKANDMSRYARFEQRDEKENNKERTGKPSFKDRERPAFGKKSFGERSSFKNHERPTFSDGERGHSGDRASRSRSFGSRPPSRSFVPALDAEVRLLPNQKTLGEIFRKLQNDHKAYALRQLAHFFLSNPKYITLRVTPRDENAEPFHVCKVCGFVTHSAEEMSAHLLAQHLTDYFTPETIDCEPPKGNFNCVAKCGMTGELLGPPNLHGYDARVKEMVRTRFPEMSEQAYRARIEIVHDKDVVEQWRNGAVKKTVFHRKGAEDVLEREATESEFHRNIEPMLTTISKVVDIPGDIALATKDLPLLYVCRDAIRREQNGRPFNFKNQNQGETVKVAPPLLSALRGAFHSRKFAFFRANDPHGPEYVSCVAPVTFNAEHAIPELAEIAQYFEKHGCVPFAQALAELSGGDEAKAKMLQQHIHWFAEKGHLVAFSDGLVAAAAKCPIHRMPAHKRKDSAVAEAKTVDSDAKSEVVEVKVEVTEAKVEIAEVKVACAPVTENVATEAVDAPVPVEPVIAEVPVEPTVAEVQPESVPVGTEVK